MRATFTPASSRAAMAGSVPVLGPRVATIFVRRITRMSSLVFHNSCSPRRQRCGKVNCLVERSAHHLELLLLKPLPEFLQQVHGPGDGGRGHALDGARGEAPLQLSDAEQDF